MATSDRIDAKITCQYPDSSKVHLHSCVASQTVGHV